MKKIIIAFVFLTGCLFTSESFAQNLPVVNTAKKSFALYMDNSDDTPLIFGYEKADVNSKRMICFSSMTVDVEGNPNKCVLGSYYESGELNIEYVSLEGGFVKLKFISDNASETVFYIEKKNVKIQ